MSMPMYDSLCTYAGVYPRDILKSCQIKVSECFELITYIQIVSPWVFDQLHHQSTLCEIYFTFPSILGIIRLKFLPV